MDRIRSLWCSCTDCSILGSSHTVGSRLCLDASLISSVGPERAVKSVKKRRRVVFCRALNFIQLSEWSILPPFSVINYDYYDFSRLKWPQIPSTGSGRVYASTITRRYEKRSEGRARCAVFTFWTRGSQDPPTSGSTGGGKTVYSCHFVFSTLWVHSAQTVGTNLYFCTCFGFREVLKSLKWGSRKFKV